MCLSESFLCMQVQRRSKASQLCLGQKSLQIKVRPSIFVCLVLSQRWYLEGAVAAVLSPIFPPGASLGGVDKQRSKASLAHVQDAKIATAHVCKLGETNSPRRPFSNHLFFNQLSWTYWLISCVMIPGIIGRADVDPLD